MNLIKLQDMLKGMPDQRLKQELDAPSGSVPQYLVLSEVVRRDKVRGSQSAERPQTTVMEDVRNASMQAVSPMAQQMMAAQMQQQQMPQEMPQEEMPAFANGGFITPATAMANAGIKGFQPTQQQQQPMSFGTPASMFTPAPAPQQQAQQQPININVQTPNNGTEQEAYPQGMAYGGVVRMNKGGGVGGYTPEMAAQIQRIADELGVSAEDIGTILSYESAGTLSPTVRGPVTQHGQHVGLLQMGEPQRKAYGYDPKGNLPSQFDAIGRYFKDNGVKAGMGMDNLYSIVNTGAPGRFNLSDENNGGAPGTVLDKVNSRSMAQHREKIRNLFGGASGTKMVGNPADREAGVISSASTGVANQPYGGAPTQYAGTDAPEKEKGFLANLFGGDFGKDFQGAAKNMVAGPAPMEVDAPVGVAGNPQAALGTKSNAQELFAQLVAARRSPFAMASGGFVSDMMSRMSPDLMEAGLSSLTGQQEQMKVDSPRGTPGNVEGVLGIKRNAEDDAILNRQYADGGPIRMADGTPQRPIPGAGFLETLTPEEKSRMSPDELDTAYDKFLKRKPTYFGPRKYATPAQRAISEANTTEEIIEANKALVEEQRVAREGTETPSPPASKSPLAPGIRGPQGYFGEQRMYDDKNIPGIVERGKAVKTANTPSALEEYRQAMEDGNQQMMDFLEEQAAAEEARGESQQGLGAFLRAAGMGMLGSGGVSFNNALSAGLGNAVMNREDARMTAAEKAAEIRSKAKLMGINSIQDLAKMKYDAALSGQLSRTELLSAAKDAAKNYTDMVTAFTKEGVPPTPEQTLEIQQAKDYAAQLARMAGLPAASGLGSGLTDDMIASVRPAN